MSKECTLLGFIGPSIILDSKPQEDEDKDQDEDQRSISKQGILLQVDW
jgi:hypothetical protein